MDVTTEERIKVYLEVLNLFSDMNDPKVQRAVARDPKKQAALAKRMANMGMRLAMLGAEDVVKEYVAFRQIAQTGGEPVDIVRAFGKLMIEMRKDLYGPACSLDSADMLECFIVGKL